ncbi:hypothetical protein YC2023_001811 [Brassica napus]
MVDLLSQEVFRDKRLNGYQLKWFDHERLTFLESGGLDKYGTEAFLVNFTAIVTILFGAFVVLTVSAKSPSPSSSIDDAETTAILLYETYSTLHSYLYCHFYYH